MSDTNSRRDAKRSMFVALLSAPAMREDQAVYLDDIGHTSGDSLPATVVRSSAFA
ncbi:MAG: hypothetical protein ACJ77E_01345 [Gaiellaceae bacterium]